MNANRHNLLGLAAKLALMLVILASTSAFGASGVAAWRGTVNSDWGTAANWLDGQLPSAPATGTGATFIDPFSPSPLVSTLGNTVPAYLWITPNAGMSVVSGGQLSIAGFLEYGNMAGGDCLPFNITGGELNVDSYISMGYGDYPAGRAALLNISGGTVTAGNIAIHTTGKAKLDISGNGKFVVNAGGNAEYYVTNGFITANGNAAGWSVNVDTNSNPGKVVLTAKNTGVPPPQGDVTWTGSVSSDWSNLGNWANGFPANALAANVIINSAANSCMVSTAGAYTLNSLYLGINAGMSVVSGGQLTISGDLVTGIWGNSLPVNITGGQLNMVGYLNMGAGGYAGSVNISGGTVTTGDLGINTTSGSKLNISGNGTFVTTNNPGLLGAIEYWVNSGFITANGNAAGWSVDLDTNSNPGKVVLTAKNTVVPPQPQGDVTWTGSVSSDWSNLGNWANGFPANALAANVIINAAANPCVVSTTGAYTLKYLYLGTNAGLSVVSGGELNISGDLTTGVWGNSLPVNITGGLLNIGGYLNMGAVGYAGSVNISGGTVTVGNFGINTASIAKLDISGNGTLITPNNPGLLGAINSYINSGLITANGNAPRWSVKVDTSSNLGKVVLTAVYQPSLPPVDFVANNAGGNNLWMNPYNWNPAKVPGVDSEYDTATVDGGRTVVLNSGEAKYVGSLTVGGTNGQGGVQIDPFCNVTFLNANISVMIGGAANGGLNPSQLLVNGGTISTAGDMVLGGSGGWVDARHYDGYCAVGGTLRVGSYLYPSDASASNVSLRLVGNSGGMTNIGAIEIGNAATVAFEFNGASSIKSLVATGAVRILPGAALVVDGTGLSGSTRDFTLFRGGSRTGTFSTVTMVNFPVGAAPSLVYTATEVKLSVTLAEPDPLLTMQSLGGGQIQTSWNFGSRESTTDLLGPWQPVLNAVSPWVEAVSGPRKFSRVKVKELKIPRVTKSWANATRLVGAGNPLYSDFSLIKDKLGGWHCIGTFGHWPADPTSSGYVLSDGYTLFHAVGSSLTAPMTLTSKISYQIASAQAYMWAPGVVMNRDNTTAFLYYFHFFGSDSPLYAQSACRLLTSSSPDLSDWRPYNGTELPEQNMVFREEVDRDFCVFWDNRLGKYLLYYCAAAGLRARTSSDLLHWSDPVTVLRDATGSPHGYSESPMVIYRDGYYYLWTSGIDYSHTHLFISEDPFNFGDAVANSIEETPGHAPEVVSEGGVDYMACSMVSTVPSKFPADYNLEGILIQPLRWDAPDPGMAERVTRKP